MDIYYNTAKILLRIYHRILSQGTHISSEVPQPQGAKIIAANHSNITDGFFLPFVFKDKLHYFIQGDIFSIPFIGWLLAKSKQIPVCAGQKKAALEEAYHLLTGGKTVVIFPEGRLNPERQPVKAGTGTVRLSLMTGAPIIPVGLYVPVQHLRNMIIQKEGRKAQGLWQFGGRCYIRIGCPWFPGQEMTGKVEENHISDLTARLMEKVEALVQVAANEYGADNKLLLSDSSIRALNS